MAAEHSTNTALTWRPTKIMNMQDLSKDDDFLSHLLVEKLGTGTVPLLVHKMDPTRKLPKTNAQDLLNVVRRLVISKGTIQQVVRQAVDHLLLFSAIRYYLKDYTQQQINAFATHASRYFELYHPSGSIEIAHTSRYSHRTGKSELCILATRLLTPGTVISELKGSMANLTDEEDRELKRTNSEIRRDFSVIHSKSMKKNHLFLGPARFVNHDCENNCELFREGKYITFRVIKPIKVGEEITAHYGDGYFGRKNRHCLCETCERNGRGGYAPENSDNEGISTDSGSDDDSANSDSDTSSSDNDEEDGAVQPYVNLDERRTRRGVYAILRNKQRQPDDSESDARTPLKRGKIELATEHETPELTSLAGTSSRINSNLSTPVVNTPSPPGSELTSLSLLSQNSPSSNTTSSPKSSPYRSIISTRRQKAAAIVSASSQLITPPLSENTTASSPISHSSGKVKPTVISSASSTPKKTKSIAEVKVKEEEVEPRLPRLKEVTNASCTKPQPTGPDGKPLPTCPTCSNLLPLISVDSQLVWGMSEASPKKKKSRQECPRCMRHFAIYGQPWPRRIPLPGTVSFLPTPREEITPESPSKHVSRKALSTLDRKLAAAAKTYGRPTKASKEERPLKKCKVESASAPVRNSKPLNSRAPLSSTAGPDSVPVKRRRGRPRLSSLPLTKVKKEEPPPPSLTEQVRIPLSRAERKNTGSASPQKSSPKRPPLSRAERASEREKQRALLEKEAPQVQSKKRPNEEPEVLDDRPRKLLKVQPRPLSFRASRLFCKPNPLSFALEAWAGPLVADSDSSEDESGPVTPADHLSKAETTVKIVQRSSTATRLDILNPSPFNFARRRWSGWMESSGRTRTLPRHPDSWTAIPIPDSYISDEEDLPRSIKQASDLQQTYPVLSKEMVAVKKPVLFSASQTPTPTPSLVDAGWDSCSEVES